MTVLVAALANVNTQLPLPPARAALQDSPVLAVTVTVPVGTRPAPVTAKLTVTG